MIYLLGLVGFLETVLLTKWVSVREGMAISIFYEYLSVNVMLEGISVFTLLKYLFSKKCNIVSERKCIHKISDYCFGTYLIHVMILSEVYRFMEVGVFRNFLTLSVLLTSASVFVISMTSSAMLSKIPLIGRYIV